MRRSIGHGLIVLALGVLVIGAIGTPRSLAAEVWTFADDFSNQSYSASDGSHPWNGPWTEAPVHNGSNRGNIGISNEGSGCSGCLTFEAALALVDSSISRSVDIEGADSARLDIHYRTDGEDAETAIVRLSIHDGSESHTLRNFPLSEDQDTMAAASFDITDHVGPNTTVRFSIIGLGLTDATLRVADVTISATFTETTTTTAGPPISVPTTTTTTTPPTTTTTRATTTTTTTPPTTTTTRATTTTTTRAPVTVTTTADGDDSPGTTTTTVIPPTQTPDYATDKGVLVSSSEDAAMAVMQPLEAMSATNRPQSIRAVTFVNAAESVRSTAVYGVGIGLLLAGFLVVGFEDPGERPRRKGRKQG